MGVVDWVWLVGQLNMAAGILGRFLSKLTCILDIICLFVHSIVLLEVINIISMLNNTKFIS